MSEGLTPEQRQQNINQFVDSYAEEQQAYDGAIRTLAGAGVAVTASLATALETLTRSGIAAFVMFLLSLGLNLVSHQTSQADLKGRIRALRAGRDDYPDGRWWMTATMWMNYASGAALIVGGVLLGVFVSGAT